MDADTRDLVRNRAGNCCEYCLLPQEASPLLTFHIEHIIARQHVDKTIDDSEALALDCNRCNAYTGTNLTSIDPETNDIVLLHNPRLDTWQDHFRFVDGKISGLTPTGRATVRLLKMNAPQRVELRQEWLDTGGEIA